MRSGGYPSARRAGWATVTTAELHVYADGTSGDDANDGLTALTPKKTLQALHDDVGPDLANHLVFCHLSGTFAAGAMLRPRGNFSKTPWVFQGEDSLVDVTGTPVWTATANDRAWLTVAGAGWAPDAWAGYFVRVSDGAAAGQWALILSSTADTVYFGKRISTVPGNASFVIGRPTTEIQGSLSVFGPGPDVYFEKLFHSGSSQVYVAFNVIVCLQGFLSTSTNARPVFCTDKGTFRTSNFMHDPAGGTLGGCGGASFLTVGKKVLIRGSYVGITGLYCCGLEMAGCDVSNLDIVRVVGATTLRSLLTAFQSGQFTTGYMASSFSNAAGVGLAISGCSNLEFGPIDVSDCGSHGIQVQSTLLHLNGVVTGTGNTGAGVYTHSGSVVHIKDGSPPTLTGTVGDLSTDGTTEATTWADVDGGDAYNDAIEGVVVKEVA